MDKAKFVQLVQALSQNNKEERKQAEILYNQALQTEPDNLVVGMMTVLGSADVDMTIRIHDAVLLRRLCLQGQDFIFSKLRRDIQLQLAAALLNLFEQEQTPKLQRKIGEIVNVIAMYVCDNADPQVQLGPGGWPDLLPLLFRMSNFASNSNVDSCETSIRSLKDLVPHLKEKVVDAKQELAQVLENSLLPGSPLNIRAAGVLLICDIVTVTEKKDWAPLLRTSGVIVQVLGQIASSSDDEDMLQEALQHLTEVATASPDFFKVQLTQTMEPANFMAKLAKTKNAATDGVRGMALEWLSTFTEKRVKWVTSKLPALPVLVLECCMEFMLEIDDGDEELQEWIQRMDDEEGDEDEDQLYHIGEECIDKVVEVVQFETVAPHLFTLIGTYTARDDWKAKHAALAAVKQTIEYADEATHMEQMAKLLLDHMNHPHPRVRFTALHALGQLANDQSPHFQESSYKEVLPVLMQKMDDPVDRVASMSLSAFVSFAEELDSSLMAEYSHAFMEKIAAKLQVTQHRGVREESITAIAVLAGNMEKDFCRYYDAVMPILKQFVQQATGSKENRLRGKAFECMSLLGIAVGKEKFLPDAKEGITEMMKVPLEADDVQRDYIKEASERICQCLKRDFAPFVPAFLPGILKTIKLEDDPAAAATDADDDEDAAYITVNTGDGKVVNVHTSRFEDMQQSLQLLYCFADEMEGAYFDWVPETAKELLPLLSCSDEATYLSDEARTVAIQTWALLIKCAREGTRERGSQDKSLYRELLTTGMTKAFTMMQSQTDPEALGAEACGVTECVKNAGPGVLDAGEVQVLVKGIFDLMDQSFKRTTELSQEKQKVKSGNANLPQELGDDESDDGELEEEEEQCRRNYEEALGAVMEVAPEEFLPCVGECAARIQQWIGTKENRVLALYLACDLINHLKDKSEQVWPVFMPQVFSSLADPEAHDAATAASYAINLAAPLPSFAQAAPQAFRALAGVVSGAKPKKRNSKARLKFDNFVAALLSLIKERPECCPPEVQAWELVLKNLPMIHDEAEAKKVHATIVNLVVQQHEGLLGTNRSNLGKILSILAEIYHTEAICDKETEAKILQIFQNIPKDILATHQNSLTEKQRKKIEKMLSC
eukprot:TRINITY_DN48385_c0_g1_i1.p1 TRINITY_DN48385_c0_g1~~TRINITY_DN48385_c0_g1_i1.p1  ORF type:complete len:1117 (-),score=262.68 TRINITY_DN48385_c0_g1_i1:431-3781(-)